MDKSQNNDNQIEQNLQLTDLEPIGEVKGGPTTLPSVTDLVIDPFNPNRVFAGSQHSGGILVCLGDGSVR